MNLKKSLQMVKLSSIKIPYKTIFSTILLMVLLATRRWQQLISPQVWSEDAVQILPSFINDGWSSLLLPVNGYLIAIPKIISFISIKISFLYYPIISTIISWLLIISVGISIMLSPTKLQQRTVCAISVFIIPSDPEVFGLPLYTFWWSGLILFLLTLWDEKDSRLIWRVFILVMCGLSSPIIITILPILYFRQYIYKSKPDEHIVGAVATLIACIQIYNIITQNASSGFPPLDSLITNIIPKFFGSFLIGSWIESYLWQFVVGGLFFILIIIFLFHQRYITTSWILFYLLVSSVALSVSRSDPSFIDPVKAGQRYFFFPFVIIFWILVQSYYSISKNYRILRTLTLTTILIAMFNAVPVWSRQHDDLNWKEHVLSCNLFYNYSIPSLTSGSRETPWYFEINADKCKYLLQSSILGKDIDTDRNPTFPYRVIANQENKVDWDINLNLREWSRGDVERNYARLVKSDFDEVYISKNNPNKLIITSSSKSDSLVGDIHLMMKRGDYFFYRSGPQSDKQIVIIEGQENIFIQQLPASDRWIKLIFSNPKLTTEFKVTIKDKSGEWGEWSAVLAQRLLY